MSGLSAAAQEAIDAIEAVMPATQRPKRVPPGPDTDPAFENRRPFEI